MNPEPHLRLKAYFDAPTSTLTYLVWDSQTLDAVLIDPVADYDAATQMVTSTSWEKIRRFIQEKGLRLHWVLETHAHADHLSGAPFVQRDTGALLGFGQRMGEVLQMFKKVYGWPADLTVDSLGADRMFGDGEEFTSGSMRWRAISTPGHTPACLTYQVGDWLFTGDMIFMPDSGVGRCDFPGGSARILYESVADWLYRIDPSTRIFVGHDYQPGGRAVAYETTVGGQRAGNIHLNRATTEKEFVAFREARDRALLPPRLLEVSLDWNLRVHRLTPRDI